MKALHNYIVAACIAAGSLSAFAGTYKAPAIYDLRGDVKSFSISTENPLAYSKKASFLKNGVQKNSFIAYSTDGHPLGDGLCLGDNLNNFLFYFQAGNSSRVDKILVQSARPDSSVSYMLNFVYDGDRVAEIFTESGAGESAPSYRFVYSAEQYDSHGNWTSRNVRQIKTDPGGATSESEYQETRKIKYFDNK